MAAHTELSLTRLQQINRTLLDILKRVATCESRLDEHAASIQRISSQALSHPPDSDERQLAKSAEARRKAVEMLHQDANHVGAPLQVQEVMRAARVATFAVEASLAPHAVLSKEISWEDSQSKESTLDGMEPASTSVASTPNEVDAAGASSHIGRPSVEGTHSSAPGSSLVDGPQTRHTDEVVDDSESCVAIVDVSKESGVDRTVEHTLVQQQEDVIPPVTVTALFPSVFGRQSRRISLRRSKESTPSTLDSYRSEFMKDAVKLTSIQPNSSRNSLKNIFSDLRAILTGDIFRTHPVVKEMFEKAHTMSLKESVWDVSLFLFYSPLGRGTNGSVLWPVVLTIFLQLSLASVVVIFVVNSEAGPLSFQSDFSTWFNNSEASEVMAVCGGDASLKSSFLQADTYETYLTYTETTVGESHGLHCAGPFTCFLVCSAWTLVVLEEFGQVMDKLLGVWNRTDRRCRAMELQLFQTPTSSGFTLLSIPLHRATWFVFVCFAQCCIAILLLIAGLRWLVNTTEIVDLLLNGVALSYIMDLDERIYSVFIPRKLSTLMCLLDPLPAPWPTRVPTRNVILAVAASVAIGVTLILIDGHLKEVIIARDILCPISLQR